MVEKPVDQIFQEIKEIRITGANSHNSYERQWIERKIDNPKLKSKVADLSIVSLHVLSALETGEKTGVEIAEELSVTRGGVTRAAKKLLTKDLIKAGKKPNNQKNIYYGLTATGKKIAQVHDDMHRMLKQKMVNALGKKYSAQELQLVSSFLDDFIKQEKDI